MSAVKQPIEMLHEKATNFRQFLQSLSPNEEAQQMMASFDTAHVLPTVTFKLLPLSIAGKIPEVADAILAKMTVPEEQKAAAKDKIMRYLNCFCEIVML